MKLFSLLNGGAAFLALLVTHQSLQAQVPNLDPILYPGPGCVNLLQNGSFESGSTGWLLSGTVSAGQGAFYGNVVQASDGNNYAYFGYDDMLGSYIQQSVVVNPGE